MRNALVTATAGLCAGMLSIAIVGCSAGTKTDVASSQGSAVTSASPQPSSTLPPVPLRADGSKTTLHDYIVENKIAETPIKAQAPGTPKVELPFPPGWSQLAKDDVPEWAYGGIIYDSPKDPTNPPIILAIANKLAGNVKQADILQYAPGMLQNLSDFEPVGEPELTKSSGFDSIVTKGTYVNNGMKMVVGEKTTVVPGKDSDFFVLQLQATAPADERQVVIDAVNFLNSNTTITAP